MSKYIKELLQIELQDKFSDVTEFVVIATRGIGGNENNEMRGDLKDKGIAIRVVKNAMMRKALENLNLPEGAQMFSEGPCTVVYGGDSVVDVSKALEGWINKIKPIDYKGAFVDGDVLDAEGAKALAKMPSRVELQGAIVMLANSPGANIAGALAGPGGAIAGCIKSLIEKLEEAA